MQAPDPAPGVPLDVAQDRAARISNLRYQVHFTIPAAQVEPVRGDVTIRFDLKDPSRPLVVDFAGPADAVGAITVAGRKSAARWTNEHIVVPAVELRAGANEVRVEFRSADGPLNRNPNFLYALFVPRARTAGVPLFRPAGPEGALARSRSTCRRRWQALSNGAESVRRRPATALVMFAETQPIPTYLFTFAAGEFQVETGRTRDGRRFRMFHRETDAREGGAEPRRDLRPARRRARLAGEVHRHPVSVRQVRLPARAGVPVRRDGAPRRDLLQRARRCCSTRPPRRTRSWGAPA